MRIIAFEVEAWEADAFDELAQTHDIHTTADALRKENAGDFSDADIVTTFINSHLNREVLQQFNDLKLIATRSTGFDHIDLDYCDRHSIAVCNVPTYGANTVAEHVFGLLLTISHRLDQAIDRTRKGDFSPRGLQGFDLQDKTMGVIGTGDIGMHSARIARGFGMNVLAYDIVQNDDAAHQIGYRYCELPELLGQSDVITLHVPANDKTRHMIGNDEFGQMKEGAVLINTARGDIVDIRAMVRALAEGKLAAAGIDVLPEEPVIREEAELLRSVYEQSHHLDTLLANHVITHLRNVVVTPHSAFNTREAVERIISTTIENINAFVEGRPRNQVNQDE